MHLKWLSSQQTLAFTGLLFLFSLAITLPAMALDDRLFQGVNVWLKTVKFQAALAVYLLSLVFFAQWVAPALLQSSRFRTYIKIVCLTCIAEIVWIGGGSTFATASHYNDSTLTMQVIYAVMGVFAVTLTSASLVIGWSILRNTDSGLDPAMRLSIGLSLILTCVLTVITAGTLSSQTGHFVGTPSTGALLPVVGWSREVGDLRVAHFFATHAMHVLPVIGLATLALPAPRVRTGAIWLAAALYSGFVGFTFVQALRAMPFWALS